MSKNDPMIRTQIKTNKIQDALVKKFVNDSFTNSLAKLGVFQPTMLNGSQYPMTRLTKNYNLMNSLYRNHWIVRRIIDTIAKDMVKNWIHFTEGVELDQAKAFNKAIRKTKTRQSLLEAIKWGRLYGGAAGLIVIRGHENILDQPLDLDDVMPDSYAGLIVLDRWSGIYPELELVSDPGDPDFGLPMYYDIQETPDAKDHGIRVHHSRILRFLGDDLPRWEKIAEVYWGASVIEQVFEELKKRDNTSYNIAQLVFLANLRVLKMQDFGQLLSTTNAKTQKTIYDTLQAQNMLMSNMGLYVIDQEDDFQNFQYTFSGLPDVYEKFMLDVAGAADIPATRLFGRSPEGMNSTGEGEEVNYNNKIEQSQEAELRPQLERLFPIIFKSCTGKLLDDMDFQFNSIYTPTQKDLAELTWRTTDAVINGYNSGLFSQRIALQELKRVGSNINMFNSITQEDIDNASSELKSLLEQGDEDGMESYSETGSRGPESAQHRPHIRQKGPEE